MPTAVERPGLSALQELIRESGVGDPGLNLGLNTKALNFSMATDQHLGGLLSEKVVEELPTDQHAVQPSDPEAAGMAVDYFLTFSDFNFSDATGGGGAGKIKFNELGGPDTTPAYAEAGDGGEASISTVQVDVFFVI